MQLDLFVQSMQHRTAADVKLLTSAPQHSLPLAIL